jgi:hypothetical protein
VVIDLETETTGVFARRRITKKGVVDGFGSLLKWFGGTATQGDLQELKTAIEVVRKSASLATMDALKMKQRVQTFSRLTNEHFDKMQSVLEQEHKSITQLYEFVRSVFDTHSSNSTLSHLH